GVVRPAPSLAVERRPGRYGAVDVGEVPRLDITVGPAGAGEHAQSVGDLLLQVDADAGPAGVGAHRGDVGGTAGERRKRIGVGKAPGAAAAEKTGDLHRARLAP